MKSFCIKTNNNTIIEYLLKNISELNIENIYYSSNKFKLYNNVIIHYLGKEISLFYNKLSNIITDCIINFYEEKLINHILNYNYFYFDFYEKNEIMQECTNLLDIKETSDFTYRRECILANVLKYLKENNSMILSGFVNFRLQSYIKSIDSAVDIAVNKFILEKEYKEFIELLKLYIKSKEPNIDSIHLIYMNEDSILLDENKNILAISQDVFNAKYLSDISFSSNDYILNTLLDLIPKEINIHLIQGDDEFIQTLKLIFENRIHICNDCDICKTYRLINKELSSRTK